MATSPLATQSAIDPAVSDSSAAELCLAEILAQSDVVNHQEPSATRIQGVLIGRLVAATESGKPLVDFAGNPGNEPRPAQSTVAVSRSDLGQPVVLMFEQGDPLRPIILGILIESPARDIGKSSDETSTVCNVRADQERLVLSANREIVLQCGQASITLTSAGKVLLRGAYVSSRSSGVNRVKGASVQIN